VRRHLGGEVAEVVEPLAAALDVLRLVGADRDRLLGDLRQFEQRLLQFALQFVGARLDVLELRLELLGALDRLLRLRLLAGGLQLADRRGDLVALVAQVVAALFQLPPLLVDVEYPVEVDVDALVVERLADDLGVLPDELSRQHLSGVPRGDPKPYRSVVTA